MGNQLGTTLAWRYIDNANCLLLLSPLILLHFAHALHFPRESRFTWGTAGQLRNLNANVWSAFPAPVSSDMGVTGFLLTIPTFKGSDMAPLWLVAVALGCKYKPA